MELHEVDLDHMEYMAAMHVGLMRSCNGRKLGLQHAHGADNGDTEAMNIPGAVGEALVAKFFNVWWGGYGDVGGADVANIQVRTHTTPGYRLILHPTDRDTDIFVSVLVQQGRGRLVGWIRGEDGKRRDYWQDPTGTGRPAFFVPNSALLPIGRLAKAGADIVDITDEREMF